MDSIIDGRALAKVREEKLKEKIRKLNGDLKVISILIGDDPPSLLYSQMKQRKAEELGIEFELRHYNASVDFLVIDEYLRNLNKDPNVNGIMIQLPLPDEFLKGKSYKELINIISPKKDIDGLTQNSPFHTAAVVAVFTILDEEKIEVKDKTCVVVGSSDLIGKPIAQGLKDLGGKVTICDSSTKDLKSETLKADILISATGVPHLIKEDMVKEGVVIIDVGVMIVEKPTQKVDGKIVGDVDFDEVSKKASKITPVPGGVGPLTVISLLENVIKAASR